MAAFRFLLPLLLFLLPLYATCSGDLKKQVYIVHLGHHSGDKTVEEIEDNHHSYLLSVKETAEDAKSSLLYSYKHTINGFAALLTPDQASKLSQREEVLSVYPSNPKKYTLHTTRSWEFLGLENNPRGRTSSSRKEDLLMKSKYGKDIIVGLIDSGVWPESKSFSDEGMEPVPSRWNGICQSGDAFDSSNCNRKIIGARYYINGYERYNGALDRTLDYLSPRDADGHGTHTTSTVGGRTVHNASLMGLASGTASGGAPLVRLAIYKVCWPTPNQQKADGNTCLEEDMLAAMDDAIADGVDVLSISIGTSEPIPYNQDGIAVGALQAIRKNIVVSCAAGNNGPGPGTLSNTAPWIITVGATTIDRDYITLLELGNGMRTEGLALSGYGLEDRMYPLVPASQVVYNNVPQDEAMQCLPGSLNPNKAKGKIVFCLRGAGLRVEKGLEVQRAGGAGLILGNNYNWGNALEYDSHFLPAIHVTYQDALTIMQYIRSTRKPMAHIFPTKTILHVKPAPYVAAFSSRGPSIITPQIIKPDISAPGVRILAAWSGASSPTKYNFDNRVVEYNFDSGTSMACPHVSATLALLKAIHPDWSSAALRSAIMTTAGLVNNEDQLIADSWGNSATPFQAGSGHLRPTKAADPGLVYDASYTDYFLFACATGQVNNPSACPENPPDPLNLNYPSIAIPRLNGPVMIERTVTNVGGHGSVYFARVRPPPGFSVRVWPRILFFDKVGDKMKFTITVQIADQGIVRNMQNGEYAFGWINWNDGIHNVRSPIAVSVA